MHSKCYDSMDESLEVTPQELQEIICLLDRLGCTIEHASKKSILGHQGETAQWLFLILSGQVKVAVVESNGQEKVLCINDKTIILGESGFFSRETYNATMIAKTDLDFIRIDHQHLKTAIMIYPTLAWKIMNSMGKKIYHLTCDIAELSFYDSYTRLCEKLLSLASENGSVNDKGEVVIELRLTDEELAQLLATQREVITRHLGKLKKRGILRRENQKIVICDVSALKQDN